MSEMEVYMWDLPGSWDNSVEGGIYIREKEHFPLLIGFVTYEGGNLFDVTLFDRFFPAGGKEVTVITVDDGNPVGSSREVIAEKITPYILTRWEMESCQ